MLLLTQILFIVILQIPLRQAHLGSIGSSDLFFESIYEKSLQRRKLAFETELTVNSVDICEDDPLATVCDRAVTLWPDDKPLTTKSASFVI